MDLTPISLSIKLAGVSTIILLAIATPLTYCLAYNQFKGKILMETFLGLPLVLPPSVLGFYLLVALGPQTVLGRFWDSMTGQTLVFTFTGIVVASMIHSLPYAIQPLKTAFEKIDPRLLESAYVLGLNPFTAFFRVVLPNALGGLVAAAVLAFAHTMGEFGVILMVGGSIPGETKVASIAIFEYVESLRYSEAWHLSLVLLGGSYFILLLVNMLNRRTAT